ncbi:hypothetical protein C8R44DRAFT_727251 [Mycena epipterygia]|nr:hypothetical protein C8R44DRAFT_727251 [Mycena epipterygia]
MAYSAYESTVQNNRFNPNNRARCSLSFGSAGAGGEVRSALLVSWTWVVVRASSPSVAEGANRHRRGAPLILVGKAGKGSKGGPDRGSADASSKAMFDPIIGANDGNQRVARHARRRRSRSGGAYMPCHPRLVQRDYGHGGRPRRGMRRAAGSRRGGAAEARESALALEDGGVGPGHRLSKSWSWRCPREKPKQAPASWAFFVPLCRDYFIFIFLLRVNIRGAWGLKGAHIWREGDSGVVRRRRWWRGKQKSVPRVKWTVKRNQSGRALPNPNSSSSPQVPLLIWVPPCVFFHLLTRAVGRWMQGREKEKSKADGKSITDAITIYMYRRSPYP